MKPISCQQIDYTLYLMQNGFCAQALGLLTQLEEADFPAQDVLCCARGIVLTEGLGRGGQAGVCLQKALTCNPDYPQAARLASTYALTYEDARTYEQAFFAAMEKTVRPAPKADGFFARLRGVVQEQENDGFHRQTAVDASVFQKGQAASLLSKSTDFPTIVYTYWLSAKESGNDVRALCFLSVLTELLRRNLTGTTALAQDILWRLARDAIEQMIRLSQSHEAKRKEYARYPCPPDMLVMEDAVAQANFYLDNYDPYDVIVLNWKASCLRAQMRYEECIAVCNTAIEAQPTGYSFHYINKALSLLMLRRYAEAKALLPMIEAESAKRDPEAARKIGEQIQEEENASEHTLCDLLPFFYHMVEASAYAAVEEQKACESTDRKDALADLTRALNRTGTEEAETLKQLLTLYTPTLVYHTLHENAAYTNDTFQSVFTDAVRGASEGFSEEMLLELCWLFAVSHHDYLFFAPLRKALFHAFRSSPTVALTLRRTVPPLYDLLLRAPESEYDPMLEEAERLVRSGYFTRM